MRVVGTAVLSALIALCCLPAQAQTLIPPLPDEATDIRAISLSDLGEFASASPDWQIAGAVLVRREVPGDVRAEPGTGVVVRVATGDGTGSNGDNGSDGDDGNGSDGDHVESGGHLISQIEHGDIELDLEVLLPAGASTGLLFQGRYELVLADSWGVATPGTEDLGAVAGRPPRINVARAPGLWQHVNVLFSAPRFDSSGRQITSAEFVRVAINGVVIQEGVTAAAVSPAAIADDAVERGPIVVRGDGGGIALRRIRYRMLDAGAARIEGVSFTYYRGDFGWEMPDTSSLEEVAEGATDAITSTLADTSNQFALRFEGNLLIPSTGPYLHEITSTGQFTLVIDGRVAVDINSPEVAAVGDVPRRVATVNLVAGRHSFVLTYARGRWHNALSALGWYVSGPTSIRTRLTAPDSDPDAVFAEFKIEPHEGPRLQRNFVRFGDSKRTHAISVGYPDGNHYAYDLATGALLYVWRGRFIDTSTMWFSRGQDQSAAPRGSTMGFSGKPFVRMAGSDVDAQIRSRGYSIDENGSPVYEYNAGELNIRDAIKPDESGRFFVRTVTLTGRVPEGTLLVLAEGGDIREVSDGVYVVADGQYYIEVEPGDAQVERGGGSTRLIANVPVGSNHTQVTYALVW